MTRIKFCGLSRVQDIEAANLLRPDYVGFVFWPKSKRFISPELAGRLRSLLAPEIQAVGVFLDERPENISALSEAGIIDVIQLHGKEDNDYISHLRDLTGKTIIKSFKADDVITAQHTTADYVMFDSGAGTGQIFTWSLIRSFPRPYFLAGGLNPENVASAITELKPFAVDVSTGIETEGVKDESKMAAFAEAVRKGEKL